MTSPHLNVGDVGDFSMNEKVVQAVLPRLHGRRILVCGNHDRCFRKHRGASRWAKQYLEWGFAEVHQRCSLLVDGRVVRVEHLPYVGDSRHGERYSEYRPVDDGSWLIHGHVHRLWQQKGRMINVGCDVWDYRPVSLDTIVERIRKGSS